MSKCPFWSTTVEKVSCNKECPMNGPKEAVSLCVFTECDLDNKFVLKEIIQDEIEYEEPKIINLPGYFEEEVF